MSGPRFDDSLAVLVATLADLVDGEFVEAGIALRDASGQLTFVAGREAANDAEHERLGAALICALGGYARKDRPIIFRGDPGSERLLAAPERLPIKVGDRFCQVIDRRIVGSGWLDEPAPAATNPPRVVFATLKGGVGRSTALAIAASDLARRNRNVLVVDLDLEAPGLGDLLLASDRVPDLGVIDYLVEDGLGGIEDSELFRFIGTSGLTQSGGGRVDVLPALGRQSNEQPENILPKLSRAMTEDVVDGKSISVAAQISNMLSRITVREQYDVVFIDSRAGLSELAAPAVLGLGATILLFGTAQKQTIEGYRALFASLQLLAQRDAAASRDADWRMLLKPVYAKASLDTSVSKRFVDEMYELYSAHIYDAETDEAQSIDMLRFARSDESAPHWPLIVPFSQNFVDFDPTRNADQLTQGFYEQTYREFLSGLDAAIGTYADISEPNA